MTRREYQDVYVDYILGHLGSAESEAFAHHLNDCPECFREIRQLRETLFALPLAVPPMEPPAGLKQKVLEQVLDETQRPVERIGAAPSPNWWRAWAVAATLVACLLGVVVYQQLERNQARAELIAILEAENQQLRETNTGLDNRINQLTAPNVRFLRLAGLEDYQQVQGSAFLFPEQDRANVYLYDLPEISSQQAFQMWVIEQGQPPTPSEVFAGEGPVTELEFPLPFDTSRVGVLAVTIEPAGGSTQPTGPMVVAGQRGGG